MKSFKVAMCAQVAVLVLFVAVASAQDPSGSDKPKKDVATVFSALKSSVTSAINQYKNNKDTLALTVSAAKSIFDKDLATATVISPKSTDSYYTDFLGNLRSASVIAPEYANEKNVLVQAGLQVFDIQLKNATDVVAQDPATEAPAPLSTKKTFDTLLKRTRDIEKSFGKNDTLKTAAQGAAKKVFDTFIGKAIDREGYDPLTEYKKNIANIDQYFPSETDANKQLFGATNQFLKSAAKAACDRSVAQRNQPK